MDSVKPRELATAARVADGLVYVAGVAGVVAGAVLFREDNVAFAMVAWVLTFVAGAVLRLAAWSARGVAQLLERSERIERDVATLIRNDAASGRASLGEGWGQPGLDEEPQRPWGRWH